MKEDVGALLIGEEEIIGAATVPDGIDADGVSDDDDALMLRLVVAAEEFVEHVGIGWVNGNDDVRLKLFEQAAETFFEGEEKAKIVGEVFLVIEEAIDGAPETWGAMDHSHVDEAGPVVGEAVGIGEKIVEFDLGGGVGDLAEAIAEAAGGAVMSFAKSGGQDQDFFQSWLGRGCSPEIAGEFNGYLSPAK